MRILILKIVFYSITFSFIISCNTALDRNSANDDVEGASSFKQSQATVIQGADEQIDSAFIERGKVLISYSDCYSCHKVEKKLIGPAFIDINNRYPRNTVFIKTLAQRIIYGGRGAWGNVEMSAHPKIKVEDAEAMVSYILSIPSTTKK